MNETLDLVLGHCPIRHYIALNHPHQKMLLSYKLLFQFEPTLYQVPGMPYRKGVANHVIPACCSTKDRVHPVAMPSPNLLNNKELIVFDEQSKLHGS